MAKQIFAIGDLAYYEEPIKEMPTSTNVQAAEQTGTAAKNIIASINDSEKK